jgi:hypothetical protein
MPSKAAWAGIEIIFLIGIYPRQMETFLQWS